VEVARPRITLLVCALALLLCIPAAARADAGDPLQYFGGPVAHSSSAVLVDWGPAINPIFSNEATGDPGLLRYLAASSGSVAVTGGVLAQYMDTTGHNAANSVTYGHQFQITPTIAGNPLQDSAVAGELVHQIEAGHLPAPSGDGTSTVYLLLFGANVSICTSDGSCTGQTVCAYHGSTALPGGTHVLYAVLPDDTTGAMSQGCGIEATPLRNQTSYLSHEWSEAITDPLVSQANYEAPPLAWYDPICPSQSSLCGEIGDKCNQDTALEGPWTVQTEWSNLDRNCEAGEPRFAQPTAAFSIPAGATPGQALPFDGSGSSDPPGNQTSASYNGTHYSIASGLDSYWWSWGDGTPGTSGPTPTHTFASRGIYTISLTVTDRLGFRATVTKQIGVGVPLNLPSLHSSERPVLGSFATGTVGSAKATVRGTIDARGQRTIFHFEYGRSRAYGHSSASAVAGDRRGPVRVRATLAGLAPNTTYHVRLVATSAAGTTLGRDFALRTARRSGRAPRLRLALSRRASLRSALRGALKLRFSCTTTCGAHFIATAVLSPRMGLIALPRALATAASHGASTGSRTVTLTFSPSARAYLRAHGATRLIVSGYATGAGGAASRPASGVIALTR
jgi:hypothetical protein